MLQLPTGTQGRFTRAQIADMSRGATAPVRVRTKCNRPDSIIRKVETFKQAATKYLLALNANSRVEAKLDEYDARDFSMWVDVVDNDARLLSPLHTTYYSLEHINRDAEQVEKMLRDELKHFLSLKREDSKTRTSSDLNDTIQRLRRDLKALPDVVRRVSRLYEKNRARVIGVRRRAGYGTSSARLGIAIRRMQNAYQAAIGEPITTPEGALALIDLAGFVLMNKTVWYGDAPTYLKRAREFLRKEVQGSR